MPDEVAEDQLAAMQAAQDGAEREPEGDPAPQPVPVAPAPVQPVVPDPEPEHVALPAPAAGPVVAPEVVEEAGADPTDMPPSKWRVYAKGVVAAITAIVSLLTGLLALTDVIPLSWVPYIAGAISVLNLIATVVKANAPTEAQVDAILANPVKARWVK